MLPTPKSVKAWNGNSRTQRTVRKWQPKKRCAKCDALKAKTLAKQTLANPTQKLAYGNQPVKISSTQFNPEDSSEQRKIYYKS